MADIESFDKFEVHKKDEHYSFIHINLSDKEEFLKNLCKFILDETNLLQYAENNTAIKFEPIKKNYVRLYKSLNRFIDDENIEIEIDDGELKAIIKEENSPISEEAGKIKIRLSKAGRIGEYIFHLILSNHFGFRCIIPKVSLTTDKNMSVFGIDELFLCMKQKIMLFGESKITKCLENGIALINRSLEKYEDEIREEFMLVLSESQIKKSGLDDLFADQQELCINFEEFIKKTKMGCIGIPLFIAHGNEVDVSTIFDKLERKIKKKEFFGLKTKYYVVSLPLIDKDEFLKFLTLEIKNKLGEYNESI